MTAESPQTVARRSKANTVRGRKERSGDDALTRDEFVARMVRSHGEWIGPFLTRWLDSDVPDVGGYKLTDVEVLRLRRAGGEAAA